MNCSNCNATLVLPAEFAGTNRRSTDRPPYEDAMTVTFGGGYGMFFDSADVNAILCTPCSEALFAAFPKLEELVSNQGN